MRSFIILAVLTVEFIILLAGCAGPGRPPIEPLAEKSDAAESARKPDGFAPIRFFQERISAIDGDRCPMHPSCSAYADQAIRKHGLFIGWIMACDRLLRCGHDECRRAIKLQVADRAYCHDPVEANDFWWRNDDKSAAPPIP